MAALRESLAAAQKGRRRAGSRNGGGADLSEALKDELGELAKRAKIAGRSKMSKDELIEALEAA